MVALLCQRNVVARIRNRDGFPVVGTYKATPLVHQGERATRVTLAKGAGY